MSGATAPRGDAEPKTEQLSTASPAAWLVFSTAGLFIFYQLVLQSLPSVIEDGLVVDFSLTNAGFGALSASFYYPYILLQVPAGLLVIRFGSRQLLLAGLVLCILASLMTAFSQEYTRVAVARILMGLGAAPSFVATVTLVTRWFPSRLFPILVALTETTGMLGAALGQEILGVVVQNAGWRIGMLLCAAFGIGVLILTLHYVTDAPEASVPSATAASRRSLRGLMRMMLAPPLILSGLIGGMIYSAGLSFAMLWGVPFFEKHMGIDLATASFCASFYSWGIIVGLLAFGWACERLASPIFLLALGTVLTGASVLVILYAPPSLIVSCLGMLFCGFASGSYVLTFVVVKSQVSDEYSGAAFAFANMLIIAVGGLVLQPLIGILADAHGRPVTDPDSLGILFWTQGVGLTLLVPLAWYLHAKRAR